MSRSVRKKPIIGAACCRSERRDKKDWHRRWRRLERRVCLTVMPVEELEAYVPLAEREISDIWNMGKDGHYYWPTSPMMRLVRYSDRGQRLNAREDESDSRWLHKLMGK